MTNAWELSLSVTPYTDKEWPKARREHAAIALLMLGWTCPRGVFWYTPEGDPYSMWLNDAWDALNKRIKLQEEQPGKQT